MHCLLDSKLVPGYIAWVIPGVKSYQVGLACTKSEDVRMKAFLEKLSDCFGFSDDLILEKRRGLIPVGGPLKNISVQDRVILIGDSAGMVSPLTGGLLHRKISGENVNVAQQLQKAFPSYFWKSRLRSLMRLHPPGFLYNIILGTPLRGFAQAIYFHSRGIFNRQFWKYLPKVFSRKSR
ncbi:MAG: lycopene cyclase family protein [Leptospirales bacterium]